MLSDFAHALIGLTENKLISSLIPVLVGAGLLSWWFKIRDRRIAVRDETLRFVNETADLMNRALSPLFRSIWTQSVDKLDAAEKAIADLFEHRLSTRAKSMALLQAPEFSREYENIVWDLRDAVDEFRLAVRSLPPPHEPDAIRLRTLPLPPPWDGFHQSARAIWGRAAALVTAGIETGIRGKKAQINVHPTRTTATLHLRNE